MNGGESAVEMPGLWKAWKTKGRFPWLSTSPLEISPKPARFPHSHGAGDEADGKAENQKQVSRFPTAPNPFRRSKPRYRAGYRPPRRRRSAPPQE